MDFIGRLRKIPKKTSYRDILQLEAVIYHDEDSKAEGLPARIRVIAPAYVKYIPNTNSFESNYSVAQVSQDKVIVQSTNEVSITDFEFVGGILFPDIISLNFTLSVDPNKDRPVGSGNANTAIVMHPICTQSQFQEWPKEPTDFVGCGSMATASFVSTAPGIVRVLNG